MEDQGFPGEGHFLLFSGSRVEKSTNNFFFFFFFVNSSRKMYFKTGQRR